jgi:hypothetical protein
MFSSSSRMRANLSRTTLMDSCNALLAMMVTSTRGVGWWSRHAGAPSWFDTLTMDRQPLLPNVFPLIHQSGACAQHQERGSKRQSFGTIFGLRIPVTTPSIAWTTS